MTVGGVVSASTTSTETVAEGERFPAVSSATTLIACGPAVAMVAARLQLVVPVATCAAPPSMDTRTSRTATLSDAVPVMSNWPETWAPFVGLTIVTVGGVESGATAWTVTATGLERFPDVSSATTEMTCEPAATASGVDQLVVPEATCAGPPSTETLT